MGRGGRCTCCVPAKSGHKSIASENQTTAAVGCLSHHKVKARDTFFTVG